MSEKCEICKLTKYPHGKEAEEMCFANCDGTGDTAGRLACYRRGYERLRAERPLDLPHSDHDDCPTYYDGCNCTVETLIHNIERAERAEHAENQRDNLRTALALLQEKFGAAEARAARSEDALSYAEGRYKKLESVLLSIARNTCCAGCQEAAQVASAALAGEEK
jgi:hypothetical protein